MEFELQHMKLESHQLILDTVLTQEETLDSIIPDAYPDASRVITSIGNGFLTVRQVGEGSARISGSACIYVLYIPEGESSPRSIPLNIPFQCTADNSQINDGSLVHSEIISVSAEARLINPRKLFVRAEIRMHVTAYSGDVRTAVCDIASHADSSLQKKCIECSDHMISAVLEKPFSFSDLMHQSASKPPMNDLLCWTMHPGTVEAKYIGKKIICKGELVLSAFYQSGSELVPTKFEVPFSQIIDMEGSFEDGNPDVTVAIKNASCTLVSGELEVSVDAVIQAALWSHRKITLLSDIYSTAVPLDTERSRCVVCSLSEQFLRRESCRKFCESEIPAKQVLRAAARLTPFVSQRGNSGIQYNGSAEVSILYITEDNALCGVEYTIPVSFTIDVPADKTCTCRGVPVGDVTAVPVTGGFEVRAEIEFSWRITGYQTVQNVVSIRRSAVAASDEKRPSVILRVVNREDDLWEIAKACSSTIDDICTVNKLTSEIPQPGSVLLIPVHR